MLVIKRDGRKVGFATKYITDAILMAAARTGNPIPDLGHVIANIEKKLEGKQEIHVEAIQDIVEKALMNSKYKDVAKEYISYRKERDIAREGGSKLLKDIEEFINQSSDEFLKENANKEAGVVSTHRDLLAGILSKHIAITQLLPKDVADAHLRGVIHFHDADYFLSPLGNCIDQSGWITIKDNKGKISTVQMKDLVEMFNLGEGTTKMPFGIRVLSRNGWSAVEAVSMRKLGTEEPIYKIKTRTGLSIDVTGEHRIPVMTMGVEGLKEAKEITTEDCLLGMASSFEQEGDGIISLLDYLDDPTLHVTSLVKLKRFVEYKYGESLQGLFKKFNIEVTTNASMLRVKVHELKALLKHIDIPYDVYSSFELTRLGGNYRTPAILQVSNELARMIGYVLADGSVSKSKVSGSYQVTFSNTNQDLIKDYIHCVNKVFPSVNVYIQPPSEKNTTPCTSVKLSSATITDLFSKFKRGSGDICLPDFILNGDEEVKYNFLAAAWDCDGCWSSTGQMSYTTVCKKYAEQVTLMLESLGFSPSLRESASKGTKYSAKGVEGFRNYDTYSVCMSSVKDLVKFKDSVSSWKGDRYTNIDRKGAVHNPDRVVKITKEYHNYRLVFDLQTSDHWFIVNNFVVHNCSLVRYEDMLEHGFKIGDAQISKPKSIGVATTILTQIAQAVSSSQYGGQSHAHIDKGLAQYVKASEDKLKVEAFKWVDENMLSEYVKEKLEKEVYDAMQSLLYQINTLTTSNGQSPFITISLGLDTSYYGRMITEQYLKVHLEGIGENKATPVFPKVVFFLEDGVNLKEGDANYDLKKLAIQCSTKRIYPDYISVPKNREITGVSEQALPVTPMGGRITA